MYVKLFSSIITSTIWTENDQTRIVWITMLACADKNGEVQASVPGLARIAGVTTEACQAAIDKFLNPDAYSRTKTDGGKRIEAIEGGWVLLNYQKYRDAASDDDRRSKAAERQRRKRERDARNGPPVTPPSRNVTPQSRQISQADADADADADYLSNGESKSKHDTAEGSCESDDDLPFFTLSQNSSSRPALNSPSKQSAKRQPKKNPRPPSDWALETADWFRSFEPDLKLKPDWREKWAAVFDKLVSEGKDRDEIRKVCSWARSSDTYGPHFHSPTRLLNTNREDLYYYDVYLKAMTPRKRKVDTNHIPGMEIPTGGPLDP